jgi:hypothetical protein
LVVMVRQERGKGACVDGCCTPIDQNAQVHEEKSFNSNFWMYPKVFHRRLYRIETSLTVFPYPIEKLMKTFMGVSVETPARLRL